jgi:hypothetical protein
MRFPGVTPGGSILLALCAGATAAPPLPPNAASDAEAARMGTRYRRPEVRALAPPLPRLSRVIELERGRIEGGDVVLRGRSPQSCLMPPPPA